VGRRVCSREVLWGRVVSTPKWLHKNVLRTFAQKSKKQQSKQDQSALSAGGQELEEVYQRKTPVEHVLLRPDSYVGSTQHTTQELWVLADPEGGVYNNKTKAKLRKCTYVPALYKIFDEILVNAADNKQRLTAHAAPGPRIPALL